MRTAFPDYEKMVVDEYLRRKENNDLSPSLVILTPADLRDECERLCAEKFEKRDEAVLRDFFGKANDQKSCLQAIRGIKLSKFKPLITYMKRKGLSKTSPKNVQLLAWLISYPDRPYDYSRDYGVKTDVKPIGRAAGVKVFEEIPEIKKIEEYAGAVEKPEECLTNAEKDPSSGNEKGLSVSVGTAEMPVSEHESDGDKENGGASKDASKEKDAKSKPPSRKVVFIGILVFVLGGGAYSIKEMVLPPPTPSSGSCMYWNKDHYEQIPCNQKMSNGLVLALDTARLNNFRMLTHKDSVLKRGKGFVWYSKIDNDVQFYTGDGRHPVEYSRRLKPATQYIIDKYAGAVKAPE